MIPDPSGLAPSGHRRDAERVHGAAGEPFPTAVQPHDEWRGRRRKGVGDVDLAALDTDQVARVERDQGLARRFGSDVRQAPDDLLNRDRAAPFDEELENAPERRRLPRGASNPPEAFQIVRGECVGGLDLKVHPFPPCPAGSRINSAASQEDAMYEGFRRFDIQTSDLQVTIRGVVGGSGPPVLLLHGNPLRLLRLS